MIADVVFANDLLEVVALQHCLYLGIDTGEYDGNREVYVIPSQGGEPRINSDGILETYPIGDVMTYPYGSEVIGTDGEIQTYAGGEVIKDVLGIPEADDEGNVATRAAGEVVTHGSDDIVYDENGERKLYSGEPKTYAAGEIKYDYEGEAETFAVVAATDIYGEIVTKENGEADLRAIELVTNENGDPVIEGNGEAATRQIDPLPPERELDQVLEDGDYYINNVTSDFVYFAVPEVEASRVAVVPDEGADEASYREENGDGSIENLQLEILSDDIPCFSMRSDAQGYVFFELKGTNKALTLAGNIRNGVNVLLKDIERVAYPQYKYWDEPLYTVADDQKWILKENDDGTYRICSYLDEDFVMTVDDQYGIQYANIMMWKDDGRDNQKFAKSISQIKNSLPYKDRDYFQERVKKFVQFSNKRPNIKNKSAYLINS